MTTIAALPSCASYDVPEHRWTVLVARTHNGAGYVGLYVDGADANTADDAVRVAQLRLIAREAVA